MPDEEIVQPIVILFSLFKVRLKCQLICLLQVMWLRTHLSSVSNTPKIDNYMEETFVYREIQQNKNEFQCASDVIKEYHRYVDVEEIVSNNPFNFFKIRFVQYPA